MTDQREPFNWKAAFGVTAVVLTPAFLISTVWMPKPVALVIWAALGCGVVGMTFYGAGRDW